MEKEITLQGYFAVALTFNDSADVFNLLQKARTRSDMIVNLASMYEKHFVTTWKAKDALLTLLYIILARFKRYAKNEQ